MLKKQNFRGFTFTFRGFKYDLIYFTHTPFLPHYISVCELMTHQAHLYVVDIFAFLILLLYTEICKGY